MGFYMRGDHELKQKEESPDVMIVRLKRLSLRVGKRRGWMRLDFQVMMRMNITFM